MTKSIWARPGGPTLMEWFAMPVTSVQLARAAGESPQTAAKSGLKTAIARPKTWLISAACVVGKGEEDGLVGQADAGVEGLDRWVVPPLDGARPDGPQGVSIQHLPSPPHNKTTQTKVRLNQSNQIEKKDWWWVCLPEIGWRWQGREGCRWPPRPALRGAVWSGHGPRVPPRGSLLSTRESPVMFFV